MRWYDVCAAGDVQAGDLGLGAVPGREAEFRQGLVLALDYARALSCKRLGVCRFLFLTTLNCGQSGFG